MPNEGEDQVGEKFEKRELSARLTDLEKSLAHVEAMLESKAKAEEKTPAERAKMVRGVRQNFEVSIYDRADRESDRTNAAKSTAQAVQYGRTVNSLGQAMAGVLAEHQNFNDQVDTAVVDLATTIENLHDHANKIGKKPFEARLRPLLVPIILSVGGIFVVIAILQPQTLTIIGNDLNSTRNLAIFLGLVAVGFVFLFYDRWSKNRAAKKARKQYS